MKWKPPAGWKIKGKPHERRGRLVYTCTTPTPPACSTCPHCGGADCHRFGGRVQRIKDLPADRPVEVAVYRQRFLCWHAGCGRTFYAPLPGVPAGYQMTARLCDHIRTLAKAQGYQRAANIAGVSLGTVGRLMHAST